VTIAKKRSVDLSFGIGDIVLYRPFGYTGLILECAPVGGFKSRGFDIAGLPLRMHVSDEMFKHNPSDWPLVV